MATVSWSKKAFDVEQSADVAIVLFEEDLGIRFNTFIAAEYAFV